MAVDRNLTHCQRDRLDAAGLGQGKAVALVNWKAPAHVGQCERALPVAAIGGADQVKQGFELGDRQQLSFAEHPAGRRKIAGEQANLSHKRL
jgi:hypothetical protein